MQLWVDLPKEQKMTEPTYQELTAKKYKPSSEPTPQGLLLTSTIFNSFPTAYPQGEEGPAIKIISGKSFGVESPVRPLGGCWYFDVSFKKAGQSVFQDIRE